mmetsp:Transcript_105689/g.187954  ORF Transcript_105689/g.187954 Transcript_105689/m.187954 type:complete len:1018 (-) Transcript_105689:67-3120(-)
MDGIIACGTNCGNISWEFVFPQLAFGAALWGVLFLVGFALALTAATSNVDVWRAYCYGYGQTKTIASIQFVLAAIQTFHFAVRTYSLAFSDVGFFLEAVTVLLFFCQLIPQWGLAHLEGVGDGVQFMFTSAFPECMMLGSLLAVPQTVVDGQSAWFSFSWLGALNLATMWGRLLEIEKVNLEIPKFAVLDAAATTFFKAYLMAMMMLTFENLGDPEFLVPFTKDKWNTISSFYFILTSVSTVGFGDLAPASSLGRFVTVLTIFGGVLWVAGVGFKCLQVFAVAASGGGFFEPFLHAKYIVVVGNPRHQMLKDFILELFHPDHADDTDELHVSVILPNNHDALTSIPAWVKSTGNFDMMGRVHIFNGTALDDKDLNRVTISAATCVFIMPDLLASNVMQEDTENIIRMMSLSRLVPKVRKILLLLRAENKQLLMEANMDSNITSMAYDQFKLEMAGKSCQVHGFGPLVCNLCKSINIEEDEEEDEADEENEAKPQWKKDFERGSGLEVYEVELSETYAAREATFIEVVIDVLEQTGGLVYLIGLVEQRPDRKNVMINPGPLYKIKQAGSMKVMGVFLAADREAIMQCDVGMVFLGRRERAADDDDSLDAAGGGEAANPANALKRRKAGSKDAHIAEINNIQLKPEQKETALKLARCVRQHQRSMKPPRPPLRLLAVGGHVIILAVGTEKTEDLRLGVDHFVKPLRQNVAPEDILPVIVLAAVQPRDWFNVEREEQVYFLQGSPTSLMDLQRVNFTGASTIFISHVGSGREMGANQEDWTVDFEVICCTRLVESQLPPGSPVVVISDIVVDGNHPFLPLPGQYGGKAADAHTGRRGFRASLADIAESGRASLLNAAAMVANPEGAKKREKIKVDDYFVQPRFAAGRLFAGGNTFTSLAANTFYNPTLIDLVSAMIMCQITMIRLPASWEGKSYFELFDYLLWRQSLLAIGIYRHADMSLGGGKEMDRSNARTSRRIASSKDTRKTVRLGFIYTAPPGKETALMPGDMIICFQAAGPDTK